GGGGLILDAEQRQRGAARGGAVAAADVGGVRGVVEGGAAVRGAGGAGGGGDQLRDPAGELERERVSVAGRFRFASSLGRAAGGERGAAVLFGDGNERLFRGGSDLEPAPGGGASAG